MDQNIYQAINGTFYDPLSVRRALISATRNGLNALIDKYRNGDETERANAEGLLVSASRAAFGLPAVDPKTGQGITDSTALAVLTAYTKWLKGKGSTARITPTPAPCTGCP